MRTKKVIVVPYGSTWPCEFEKIKRELLPVIGEYMNMLEVHQLTDYLRTHLEDVAEYSKIKQEAAALYPTDIDAYIAYKSPCIEKYIKRVAYEHKSRKAVASFITYLHHSKMKQKDLNPRWSKSFYLHITIPLR